MQNPMESETEIVAVELSDGTVVNIEARAIGGEEELVGAGTQAFKGALNTIKSITNEIASTLQDVKQETGSDKISVKLGLEIAVESGEITALIVKGTGKANLEITMEWGK